MEFDLSHEKLEKKKTLDSVLLLLQMHEESLEHAMRSCKTFVSYVINLSKNKNDAFIKKQAANPSNH